MNNLDKKIGAPSLPSVNLIPREIAEATKMRAVKVTALLAVLIAVGVIVAGYVLALGAKQLAKSNLEDAVNEQTQVIAERDSQKVVFEDLSAYESKAWTLGQIGFGDIAIPDLVYSLLGTADDTTSYQNIIFYGPSATGSGNRNSSETAVPGMGTLQFTGFAESYENATELATRIEDLPGLEQVILTAEAYTEADGTLAWGIDGTVTVTDSALTGRFLDDEAPVQVDPGVSSEDTPEPVAPSPEPSPSPSEES